MRRDKSKSFHSPVLKDKLQSGNHPISRNPKNHVLQNDTKHEWKRSEDSLLHTAHQGSQESFEG